MGLPTSKPDVKDLSIREQAQLAVKTFKQSWVAVGQILMDIAYGADYKEWPRASVGNKVSSVASSNSSGEKSLNSANECYKSFDEYCWVELNIKPRQVKKLMNSYQYLKQNKPQQLRAILDGEDVPCPGYEVINDIRSAQGMAETVGNYDSNALKEVESKLFEGEITGREATQEIREARIAPEDVTPPSKQVAADPTVKQVRKITSEYQKLCTRVKKNERIPEAIVELMEKALKELQAITDL